MSGAAASSDRSDGLAVTYGDLEHGAAAIIGTADLVKVDGPDASSWLQGQVSQDLEPMRPGDSREALVLSPQGKVDSYCQVVRAAESSWCLVTRTGYGEALAGRLRRFKLRVKLELSLREAGLVRIRGPKAAELVDSISERADVIAKVGVDWPGWVGWDLVVEPESVDGGDREPEVAGAAEAFEARRIQAGVPLLGAEITDRTIAHEAGLLVAHAVSFTKGCYTGQELVARIDARGANVARRLRLIHVSALPGAGAGDPADGDPADGDPVLVAGAEVGQLTSVARLPGRPAAVGLAYVKRGTSVPAPAEVVRRAGGGASPAEITALPGTDP